MSDNVHVKSDKLYSLGAKFLVPSLIYPAFLLLWGLVSATSMFLTGHGIDLGLSVGRVFLGLVPFTIPWLIVAIIIFVCADDEAKLENARR